MKVTAVVDGGCASGAYYREYLDRIRRETGADALLMITDGDLSRMGGLAARDKYERTEAFLDAGASCVVEMPLYAGLLRDNVYAFAVSALLRKLGCVDALAVPCDRTDMPLFDRVSEFLFDEPMAYQKRMRALRARGEDLDAALPEVAGSFVDGAEGFLKRPVNRMAVEYRNILRKTYSSVVPHWIQADAPAEAQAAPGQDRYLLRRISGCFLERTEQETIAWATDMYSGNRQMAGRVLNALRTDAPAGWEELSCRAACPGMNALAVRRFLLSCLIGYRKVDSMVCITYNYVPYIRVLGSRHDGLMPLLLEKAGTTVLIDAARETDFSRLQDDYKRMLVQMDDRARTLYAESTRP